MSNRLVPNAKDVLPRGLLLKLQRHCSGLIYIPAPQTKAQMNMARVRSLHSRGYGPARIAQMVDLSTKHVRDIIERFESGDLHGAKSDYRVYETVPREIVELVQRHVCGPIYVPHKTSQATRRLAIVQRLLRKGVAVSEIAKRVGLSERRVWQMKAETELAQLRLANGKTRANKEKPQDPFEVSPVADPGYVPPKLCSTCGIPVGPNEEECDVCRYLAETKRNADNGEIVITRFPFAIIDRKF